MSYINLGTALFVLCMQIWVWKLNDWDFKKIFFFKKDSSGYPNWLVGLNYLNIIMFFLNVALGFRWI